MATTLLIVRHGQSVGNLKEIYLGHTNLDLSELGHAQAEITAEYLKNENIDKVYSSDLIRAYNTVLPLAKTRGLEIETSQELREIYAGEWENKSYNYLYENYYEDYRIWRKDIGNARCTGGESVMELQERIYNELKRIASQNDKKTICIGTHATPIRTFYSKCMKIGKNDMFKVPWASNASVTKAVYDNGKFYISEYGYDKHLGEIISAFSTNI